MQGIFLDGNRVTPGTAQCKCGPNCEMPCWMRIGLTETPCCKECGPLPKVEEREEDDCVVNLVSSRMCEHGTKGCEVVHIP